MCKGQENKYRFEVMTPESWAPDNERFILENNDGKLSPTAQSIFVLECSDLVWDQEEEMKFQVVVSCVCVFKGVLSFDNL